MTDETAARLAQIRAREQAATPGPWTWTPGMIQASGDEIIMWPANIPLCDDDELDAAMRLGTCGQHAEDHAEDNLAFLAAAREDVPWLLNLVDQLRARIDAVRELGERWAALAPADDWGDSMGDTAAADAGRALLAALDATPAAEPDPLNLPAYAWGESVTWNQGRILVPLNRDNETVADLVLAEDDAGTLSAMLDDAAGATEGTDWGEPGAQWTCGVRRPDGSTILDEDAPLPDDESAVRAYVDAMQDGNGYRKALLRRDVSAWREADAQPVARGAAERTPHSEDTRPEPPAEHWEYRHLMSEGALWPLCRASGMTPWTTRYRREVDCPACLQILAAPPIEAADSGNIEPCPG